MADRGREGMLALKKQRELGFGGGVVVEYGFGENVLDRVCTFYALKEIEGLEWIRVVPVKPGQPGADPMSATAQDHLQMTALGRILLPNVPEHRAPWLPGTAVIAQQALLAGSNGLGTVLLPEASTTEDWRVIEKDIRYALLDVGLQMDGEDDVKQPRYRAGRPQQPQIR